MKRLFLCLLLCLVPTCLLAEQNDRCDFGQGSVAREVAGFKIRIAPHRYKGDTVFAQCLALIRDNSGKIIFSQHDAGFSLILAGEDVNGDGTPDVVLEEFSGGAHCCWTYYIVSLGKKPGLLLTFGNALPVKFEKNENSGRIEMSTADGAFDYFDGACHPCSPFPRVFLRLDGKKLVDTGSEHIAFYDQEINDLRKDLPPNDVERLHSRKAQYSDEEARVTDRIAQKVLTVVVAYLYSGRKDEGHQVLQEMWPPYDQERMWSLILETRQNGILSFTRPNTHK